MSDPDSPAPPKPDPQRRAELEDMFARWDAQKSVTPTPPEPDTDDPREIARLIGTSRIDTVHLMVTLTALLACLSGWFMLQTYPQFTYWLQGGDSPTELGSLSERWRAGETTLPVDDNRWVQVSGMFATYEHIPDQEALEDAQRRGDPAPPWYFVCPLYDIVVRTSQPAPDKPVMRNVELEADFMPLIQSRRAFPTDLTTPLSARGRLVQATRLGSHEASMIARVAAAAGRDPREVRVLFDGDEPGSYLSFAILWFVAPLMPLSTLIAVVVMRRRRREDG